MIPDESQALELHAKYGSNERIVSHCRAVARITKTLLGRLRESGVEVDEKATVAAALLHDIGRNRTQAAQHGLAGAEILQAEGVDKKVAEIVRRHVGAGISQEEARALGFPEGDYVPRTIEQKVVSFADKMVDGARARPFEEEVKRFIAKGHDVERLRRLKDDVAAALREDPENLVLRDP